MKKRYRRGERVFGAAGRNDKKIPNRRNIRPGEFRAGERGGGGAGEEKRVYFHGRAEAIRPPARAETPKTQTIWHCARE